MYIRPIVENICIDASLDIKFNPKGPIMIPAKIKPIILGTRIRFKKMGTNKTMVSKTRNTITGLDNGNENSCEKLLSNIAPISNQN
jgi:L-lysine 2,3-aminomutase